MTVKAQKTWIVLVNKVPRGPLSEEQIAALLEQGILRRNDVAFEISTSKEGKTEGKRETGWKLLWQFQEFDRRLSQPRENAVPPSSQNGSLSSSGPGGDRRASLSEQEIRKRTEAAVPSEIFEIAPEELVVRSSSSHAPTEMPLPDENPSGNSSPSGGSPGFGGHLRLLSGLAIILVLAFFVLSRKPPTPRAGRSVKAPKSAPSALSEAPFRKNLPQKRDSTNEIVDQTNSSRQPEGTDSDEGSGVDRDRSSRAASSSPRERQKGVLRNLPVDEMPPADHGEVIPDEDNEDDLAWAERKAKKKKKRRNADDLSDDPTEDDDGNRERIPANSGVDESGSTDNYDDEGTSREGRRSDRYED